MGELLLSGYFDASSQTLDPDASVMFVSGCVATDAKWKRFERQWLGLLDQAGISRPFRMSKFWAEFRDRPDERARFAEAAIKTIKRNIRKSFSSGVELKPYEAIRTARVLPDLINNPYTLCASKVIAHVGEWIKRRDVRGRIGFLFEDGDLGQAAFAAALQDATGVDVEFLAKQDLSPFDSGDMIAWLHSRSYQRHLSERGNDVHRLLLELARQVPGQEDWGIHDEAWFAEHGHRWPERGKGP